MSKSAEKVNLATMHAAKGLEFKVCNYIVVHLRSCTVPVVSYGSDFSNLCNF